ncbi:MAG: DinB family protein [Alphaproteobacteria bacterium]|jgi:uncharacterized damage-inducible protein DinB|nr:DinB family protein [Alphaproteobacteria bacterium]
MLLDLPTAARYNAWANKRLYAVAEQLTPEQFAEDRRGFFQSAMGTLNHMLLSDLIYRERLEKKPTTFTRLDEILYTELGPLRDAQCDQDVWYVNFCEAMDPAELEGTLSFDTVETGEFFSLPLRNCLTNLFQHQIHHRGQTHHMLSHAGLEPPPLDVIKFASGE